MLANQLRSGTSTPARRAGKREGLWRGGACTLLSREAQPRQSRIPVVRYHTAVLAIAGVLAYAGSFAGPFLFDDQNTVVKNATIRTLTPISVPLSPPRETPVAGRPAVNLTFAANYAAGGLDVTGYHVVNLAVHLLVGLALFGVVRRTLRLPSDAGRSVAARRRRGAGGGARVGASSAQHRGRELREPAHRVAHGAVLPADALRRHPGRGAPGAVGLAGGVDRRVRDRHGLEGVDGHRAGAGAALRPRLPVSVVQDRAPRAGGALRGPGRDVGRARGAAPRRAAIERGAVHRGHALDLSPQPAVADRPLPGAHRLAPRARARLRPAAAARRGRRAAAGRAGRGPRPAHAVRAVAAPDARLPRRVVLRDARAGLERGADCHRSGGRAADVSAAHGAGGARGRRGAAAVRAARVGRVACAAGRHRRRLPAARRRHRRCARGNTRASGRSRRRTSIAIRTGVRD